MPSEEANIRWRNWYLLELLLYVANVFHLAKEPALLISIDIILFVQRRVYESIRNLYLGLVSAVIIATAIPYKA